MGITDRYRALADLPAQLPIFPLQGCILLPRSNLPLNIFEPRYLSMVDDIIAGNRIIGIVQPLGAEEDRRPRRVIRCARQAAPEGCRPFRKPRMGGFS